MKKLKDISVVIPVYNSKGCLQELVKRISQVLEGNHTYEIVLIDDGSSDGSWQIIESLKKDYKNNLKAIRLKRNYGQHSAIMCGFSFTQGELILTMDDDLQHPPEEILKLIEKQKETGVDIVYGIPKNKKHNSVRRAGSFFTRKSSKYFANNPIGEGSSFRLIKKNIIDQINLLHSNNYVFIDEIIFWFTSNVEQVQVEHHERYAGKSGYNVFKLIKLYFDVFTNYTANPLKIMIYFGLLSSVISFIFGARFILKKIMVGAPLGYTSLIVSILFSTSVIMLCLGIIGKYIFNLYQNQSGKPLYSISSII